MIIVYVVCKDKEEAKKIGKKLVDERLVACANFFPLNSIYWWKDKIVEDEEVALLLKSKKENFEKIKEEVINLHSYEVPCIIQLDVAKADEEYLKWLKGEVE